MPGRLTHDMREKGAPPDQLIATIAACQHGVVSIRQLREEGLDHAAVHRRMKAGRLHRLHRGVYAVGHLGLTHEKRCMAAVLAFPAGAVVSHRDAATLWRLLPAAPGPVDIALPSRGGRRRRAGIKVHRCATLTPDKVTRHRGIPVTKPARTLSDLRHVLPPAELRRAIRQAEMLGLPLGPHAEGDRTRSELERLFLRLCRRHGLQMPEVNARVGPLTVDFLWRDRQLVVETDGYRYHRGRAAFEDDHERDLKLRERGFEVVRLTYRQVVEEPKRVAAILMERSPPGAVRARGSWR